MIRITIDGETYIVNSRIERIIRWLLSQAERISNLERVKVIFHCAGPRVGYEINEAGNI